MKRLLLALFLWLAALPATAQDAATLVADRVLLSGNSTLIAEGSVEVFFKGAVLKARRIVYDRTTDKLTIEGPITLNDGKGTVLLAGAAELSRDLSEGLLTSARMVLQEQLQLAAHEIRRSEGRYTELTRVVASSCRICPGQPTPLWEIRAKRVVHDQEQRRLTFEHAQLRFAGVPVFYVPRMRLPDPTVDRATGFLAPKIRTNSALGFGVMLPYFIAIGDSRDLTITPYYAVSRTATLNLRYREATRTGSFAVEGAVTRDSLIAGELRGYVLSSGRFALPKGFELRYSLEAVSDPAYLLDYGITDRDRLESGVSVTRTRKNEYAEARFTHYRSIRAGESNATLPTIVADGILLRRFRPEILGGQGGFSFRLHAQGRTSTSLLDGDGDGEADGRDVARASASLDWRRNWTLPGGILGAAMFETTAQAYAIAQDPAYPGAVVRIVPAAAVELRWPWVKASGNGAAQMIEPVVQVVWSPDSLTAVPNEDSRVVEFDEGNLFSLNRFPGSDRYERGLRANIGVSWTRLDPSGWSFGVTGGRVLRGRDLVQFTNGSGLDGTSSDWLLAAEVRSAGGLTLTNRALFDDTFSFTKNELRMGLDSARYDLAASYIYMIADPAEGRPSDTSELTLDAGWQITDGWRGRVNTRYDAVAERAAAAGFGLTYRNECASVDLSLSRRFTSSTSVDPATDFNLSVTLLGFGAGAAGVRRSCGG
jgi:LPS-assembly protein